MPTIALVPARGGSKGLENKNLAEVGGKSLVARAVEVGRAVAVVDEVVVSSDSAAILVEGNRAGATPLERPAPLAADETPTIDVVLHLLDERPHADRIVLLQPTSPLRTPEDVLACLEALRTAPTAATVVACEPVEWVFRVGADGHLDPVLGWGSMASRRQETASVFRLNGAVYGAEAVYVRTTRQLVGPETIGVPMPRERSIDVDDQTDLVTARALIEAGHGA